VVAGFIMPSDKQPNLTFFVVFEPSYALGCLATLSSLARRASRPVVIDILMRDAYRGAAQSVIDKLKTAHGDKIQLRAVIVPAEIVALCDAVQFKAHFIPEILFRLHYFDFVKAHGDYVAYLDIDMMLLRDAYTVLEDMQVPALLHVVEAPLNEFSAIVTPSRMTRYINSGFMVFDASNAAALLEQMHLSQQVVKEIADQSLYIDQDAVNIAFYEQRQYLPRRWNFTLQHFTGFPLPADTVVLHATGSQKPWFFRGRHPFKAWYEEEADFLGLNFLQRYDFTWALRRIGKKLAIRFGI
jgi:lipopolysaccharide biosynthesis glycosyltransferase